MLKFTDKYINNFDILKNAIVGFEFEFYTDRPYYKLLELLNRELAPIKISGFRKYHSSFKPTKNHWKFEPDTSLGANGVELITGPLEYVNSKVYLLKILKILQSKEFKTDEKCGIHINISFDKEKSQKILNNLNKLKMILSIDEEFIYKYFPTRRNNFYAKSIKKIIPFKNFDFSFYGSSIIQNNLELPDTKYYGVNFLNMYDGRLEFRYIGDKDYQFKTAEILDLLDYFLILTWNCINEQLTEDEMDNLTDYLEENINQFKNFSKYNNFIAEFPTITLQIDKNDNPIIIKSYYEQIYNELYNVITNIYNLSDCIINYDTNEKKIEIVDATFKSIFDINNINLINCNITNGTFINCYIVNSEIKNAHLEKSKLLFSEAFKCKIENSKIENGSILNECYIYNSFIDCDMKGGVFRSGKIGELAVIDKNVKIITSENNYFGKDKEQSYSDKIKSIGAIIKNSSKKDKNTF
jgi:hypothetical protein